MTDFYDRSNQYASSVFYDRSNAFSESDLTQQITFSGVDLSFHSLAYNAPFVVVDGDYAIVPLIVAGSALDADPSGNYTFTPPVPDGTTFTRILYDVSASQSYSETITVYNTAPAISLSSASVITVSGTAKELANGSITIDSPSSISVSGHASTGTSGSVVVSSASAITVSGRASSGTNGSVALSASASFTVSGTASTDTNGSVTISSAAEFTVSGTQSTSKSGSVALSGLSDFTVSGTAFTTLAFSGSVSVTALSSIVVRGTSSGRQFVEAKNRIFIFD